MASVAKWHVGRSSAAAKCHSIAHLVGFAVMRLYPDAATNPEWPAAAKSRVFNQSYRWSKLVFNFIPGLFVMRNQPSCRAVICFADNQFTSLGGVSLLYQVPYLAGRIAKSRKCGDSRHPLKPS